MSDLTISILSSLGLTGAAVWILKNWLATKIKAEVEHGYNAKLETLKADYNQRLETLKSELAHANNERLERFKSELMVMVAEKNFRFSKVFEQTAETIAKTYTHLLDLKDAADTYTQHIKPSKVSREEARVKYQEKAEMFSRYFLPNKIYLPKATGAKVAEFTLVLHRAAIQFGQALAEAKSPNRPEESYGKIFKEFFQTSEEVPKLLEILEDDFQSLLGFHKETPKESAQHAQCR